jgi:hypothetical protein
MRWMREEKNINERLLEVVEGEKEVGSWNRGRY